MDKQEHFKKYYYKQAYIRDRCLAIADVFKELSDLNKGYIDAMRESADDIHWIENELNKPMYDPEMYPDPDTSENMVISLDNPHHYETLNDRIERITRTVKYSVHNKKTRAYFGPGSTSRTEDLLIHTLFTQHLGDIDRNAGILLKKNPPIWKFIKGGCSQLR